MKALLLMVAFTTSTFAACPDEIVRQLGALYLEVEEAASLTLSSRLKECYEQKLKEAAAQYAELSAEALQAKIVSCLRNGRPRSQRTPKLRSEKITITGNTFVKVKEFEAKQKLPMIAASLDGKQVAITSDTDLETYDPRFEKRLHVNTGFKGIYGMEYNRNNRMINILDSKALHVVDRGNLMKLDAYPQGAKVPGPTLGYGTAQSPDGTLFVGSSHSKGAVYLRDSNGLKGENPLKLSTQKAEGWAAAFLNDFEFLLARANPGIIEKWVTDGAEDKPEPINSARIRGTPLGMKHLPGSDGILVLFSDGRLIEYHVHDLKTLRRLETHKSEEKAVLPFHLFFLTSTGSMAVGSPDGYSIAAWDVRSGKILQVIEGKEGHRFTDVAFVENENETLIIASLTRFDRDRPRSVISVWEQD